jgi:hypothetical protein
MIDAREDPILLACIEVRSKNVRNIAGVEYASSCGNIMSLPARARDDDFILIHAAFFLPV